jgi:uncharacterized protein YndB with AHSA1/START domain
MIKKIFLYGFILSFLGIGAVLLLSPYKRFSNETRPDIRQSVIIDAPADSVYAYLGNSANAARWSVFVHHISPLNPDSVPDGSAGSLRRCFQRADETGLRWDEEILIAEPAKRRRLSIFNLIGFPANAKGLMTEQWYETTPDGRTRLTFTVFFLEKPSAWDTLKIRLFAWRIAAIFKSNMENIKKEIEA